MQYVKVYLMWIVERLNMQHLYNGSAVIFIELSHYDSEIERSVIYE